MRATGVNEKIKSLKIEIQRQVESSEDARTTVALVATPSAYWSMNKEDQQYNQQLQA